MTKIESQIEIIRICQMIKKSDCEFVLYPWSLWSVQSLEEQKGLGSQKICIFPMFCLVHQLSINKLIEFATSNNDWDECWKKGNQVLYYYCF